MGRIWTFFEFVSAGGRGVMTDWYNGASEEAQQDFDTLLQYLAVNRRDLWRLPEFRMLSNYKGLFELRFKSNRVQYRPLGFFGPGQGKVTLLIAAQERGGKFNPRDAPDLALKRKALVENVPNSRTRIYEY
jgi:hypothetical protein